MSRRNLFSNEAKVKIVRQALEVRDRPNGIQNLAEILEVHPSSIYNWIKAYESGELFSAKREDNNLGDLISILNSIDSTLKTILQLMEDPAETENESLPDNLLEAMDEAMNKEQTNPENL